MCYMCLILDNSLEPFTYMLFGGHGKRRALDGWFIQIYNLIQNQLAVGTNPFYILMEEQHDTCSNDTFYGIISNIGLRFSNNIYKNYSFKGIR